MATRYFTLEEANASLTVIRPLVRQILALRAGILARRPEIWPVLEKAAGNGGSRDATQMEQDFEKLDALVHRLQSAGVLLKDINTGLVDFPSLREGREIYLCWRFGEETVRFWHEVDAGFGGRKPL